MRRALLTITAITAGPIASAQVIDTYPFWDGQVNSLPPILANSFDAPNSILKSVRFGIEGGAGTLIVEVRPWIPGFGPNGETTIFERIVQGPATSGDVFLDDINVPLVPGQHYGLVVDMWFASAIGAHFMNNVTGSPTGHLYWGSGGQWDPVPGKSLKFQAQFVPEPTTIAALALGAALVRRRTRRPL